MKKTVLIIEHKKKHWNELTDNILAVDKETDIYTVDGATAAYELLMEMTIDVFLVDVVLNPQIPGDISGIRLVERIRQIFKYTMTPVIFISGAEDPSMYAYTELNCIGYIKSPYRQEELRLLFEKALYYRRDCKEDKSLLFRKGDIIFPVWIRKIVYIESIEHVMHIHLCDGGLLCVPYKTHGGILYEADTACLFQCSRKVVVNKEYVLAIDVSKHNILLRNDMGRIPIGYTYKKKVMKEFAEAK